MVNVFVKHCFFFISLFQIALLFHHQIHTLSRLILTVYTQLCVISRNLIKQLFFYTCFCIKMAMYGHMCWHERT